MNCLTCSKQLETVQREGVQIDQCPDGHGVWLDGSELVALVDTMEVEHTPEERRAAQAARETNPEGLRSESPHSCPKCGGAMEKVNYDEWSGIVIDSCFDDGVWLDQGELDRAEEWIEGSDEALAPLKQHLADEQAAAEAELNSALASGAKWGPFKHIVGTLALRRDHNALDAYLDDDSARR